MRNIKKKAALLLAFVMLVSMVPVNVFGNEPAVTNQQHQGMMNNANVGSGLHDTTTIAGWDGLNNAQRNTWFSQGMPGGIGNYNAVNDRTWLSTVTVTVPFNALHGRSSRVAANHPIFGNQVLYETRLQLESRYAGVFANDLRNNNATDRTGAPVWSNRSRGNVNESVNTNPNQIFSANQMTANPGFNNGRFEGVRFLTGSTTGNVPTFPAFPGAGVPVEFALLNTPELIGGAGPGFALNANVVLGTALGNYYPVVQLGSVWGHRIVPVTHPNSTRLNDITGFANGVLPEASFVAWSRPLVVAAANAQPGSTVYVATDFTTSGPSILPTILGDVNDAGYVGIETRHLGVAPPAGGAPTGEHAGVAIITSQTGGTLSTAVVAVYTTTPIGAGHTGTLTFELPMRGQRENNNWQNSTLTVRTAPESGAFVTIINQFRLAVVGVRSLNWSVTGGPRGFSSSLHVPPLRISENQFGTLNNANGGMHIRLEAPAFYSWSFAPVAGVGVTQDIVSGRTGLNAPLEIRAGGIADGNSFQTTPAGTPGPTSVPGIGGSEVILEYGSIWGNRTAPAGAAPNAMGLHRIYIPINNFERNNAWAPSTGWIEIRNLWLVPDANAQTTGEVNIGVQVGRFSGTGNVTVTGTPEQGWQVVSIANNATIPSNASNIPSGLLPGQVNNTGGSINVIVPVTTGGNIVGATGDVPYLNDVLQPGQRTTLHVGNRGRADLSVEVHDGPAEMRTGHLGNFRAANWVHSQGEHGRPNSTPGDGPRGTWRWNRDNEGLAFHHGVQTSVLIIEENIPGGFSTGFGSPINFEFLDDDGNVHPGIRILGMEARAGNFRTSDWNRGELNNFWGGNEGIAGPSGVLPILGQAAGQDIPAGSFGPWRNSNQNWMTFRGWVSALDQRMPNVANVGRISDLGATLYLPSQNINEVNPNVPNHHNHGILEVRFWLSVEAGFEWKYGENIDVTISGAGVSSLGTYTATVGLARDSIQMNLAEGVTPVETGTLYNIVGGVQPISDVIINVEDNGAFGIGEELWIYVGTDTIGRNFDINLVNIPTVTVNEASGLRLDTGRLMAPTAGGHLGRAGVAFTVARQPYGGDAPAPVITISNLNVEGQAFPGVEYQIIISGTGVANNDQEVFNALRLANRPHITQPAPVAGLAQAAAISPMSRGVFTSLPFNETVLENVFGGVWDTAPEPAPLPPAVVGPVEHRLWAGMGPIAGVDDPFRWVDTPGTNLRVGFLSARAFGYIINGSPDVGVEWNEATNTATITGEDINGNSVSVVMTVGSNIAQINGVPTDIAAFAGASGPDGSIQVVPTPDGRIFLPIRFLTNAFGRTVTGEGEVVVIR